MTYKTAKTLKLNTLTFKAIRTLQYEKSTMVRKEASVPFVTVDSDTTVGYSGLVGYVNSNKTEKEPREAPRLGFKKGPEPKFKKTKLVPVPFSKTALASIEEALSMGGFKDWADFKSLKGIGPVTSKIMEDLGWNETMFFFYKENATGSGVTRVSNFFTLKQVKHKHPSGVNWRSPNPNKQISAEFCGGAMVAIGWPGAKRKGIKPKCVARDTKHVDIAVEFHKHLMASANQVLSDGGCVMGWKFSHPEAIRKPYGYVRDEKTFVRFLTTEVDEAEGDKLIYPDGDMFLVERPIPSGLHTGDCTLVRPLELAEDLTTNLAALMNVPCKLVNIYRDGKSGTMKVGYNERVGGFHWKIAPKAEQSHDVVLKDPMPGLTDTDKEHHNVVMASLSEQNDQKRAALEEERRKENEELVEKGLKPKLFGRDWIEYLYEVYLEMTSKNGWGAVMKEAEEKVKDFQAKEEVYDTFFKPLFPKWAFLREFEQKWFKASKHGKITSAEEEEYSRLMKDAPGTFNCWQDLSNENLKLSKELSDSLAGIPEELRDMKWKFENYVLNTKLETQFEERAQADTIGGNFSSANAKMFSSVEEGLKEGAALVLDSLATRSDSSWEFSCLEAIAENLKEEHIYITGLNRNIGKLGYAEKRAHMSSKLNLLRNGSEEFKVNLREITRVVSGTKWKEGLREEVYSGEDVLWSKDIGLEKDIYLQRTFNWEPSTVEIIQKGGIAKSKPIKKVETEEDYWAQVDTHGLLNK